MYYSVPTVTIVEECTTRTGRCQFVTYMAKQAHHGLSEVSEQQLLIPKAHSQHPVEELGNSLVLLKHGVTWPADIVQQIFVALQDYT